MTVALYVPGDRPDRFEKAVQAGADIVILDLEDAVAEHNKPEAREAVARWLREQTSIDSFQVRINASSSDDLQALADIPVPIRVPKVRGAADIDAVVDRIGDRPVHALIEDAVGVVSLGEIAHHPAVASVAIGEADLAGDLGSPSAAMRDHVRMQLVIAVRAAGLPAPLMAAFPAIGDLKGLAADCAAGAALGFGGRTAIHPSQIAVIRQAFAPSRDDVVWAEEVLSVLDADGGVGTLADGSMVDRAMRAKAERIRDSRLR